MKHPNYLDYEALMLDKCNLDFHFNKTSPNTSGEDCKSYKSIQFVVLSSCKNDLGRCDMRLKYWKASGTEFSVYGLPLGLSM